MAKKLKEEETKQMKKNNKINETSSTNNSKHKGGLVLANKIFEPLDILLMAYKSRLKSKDTLEVQWEKYQDPKFEKCQLRLHKNSWNKDKNNKMKE